MEYVTNGSKLIRPHCIGLVRMSYMYGIYCVQFFFRKSACQKYFFQILSQKTLRLWMSKIRWLWIHEIHPECGFYGFVIRFWICPKNAKSVFGFGNPDLDFPQKTHPKCRYFYLSAHVVVELSSNIMRGNWGFRWWPKNALLWQTGEQPKSCRDGPGRRYLA